MNIKCDSLIRILMLVLVVSAFFITSCYLDVPIKEMATAKANISRAVEVKAGKYAPEDLKEAKDYLLNSHEAVEKENVETAKEEAIKSNEFAEKAIQKSLPPLANDFYADAKKVYNEADLAFAEKYAPDEFKEAGDNLNEAEDLLNKENFWNSYQKSKIAIFKATSARDKAYTNIPKLEDEIIRISKDTDNLEAKRGAEFAPEDIEIIYSNLEQAVSYIEIKNLKDSFARITEASEALNRATLKTEKDIAAENITIAENAFQRLQESDMKEDFVQDITKASELISMSKELFEMQSYNDSTIKSEEAIQLLGSISIAMEKKAEEIRIREERERIESEKRLALQKESDEEIPVTNVDSKKQKREEIITKAYVVRLNPNKRDCLWRIAFNIYKDARLWPIIYMANRDKIKDPDLIFPGQNLTIPPFPYEEEKIDEGEIEEEEIAEIDELNQDEKGEKETDDVDTKKVDMNREEEMVIETEVETESKEKTEVGKEALEENSEYDEDMDEDTPLIEETTSGTSN